MSLNRASADRLPSGEYQWTDSKGAKITAYEPPGTLDGPTRFSVTIPGTHYVKSDGWNHEEYGGHEVHHFYRDADGNFVYGGSETDATRQQERFFQDCQDAGMAEVSMELARIAKGAKRVSRQAGIRLPTYESMPGYVQDQSQFNYEVSISKRDTSTPFGCYVLASLPFVLLVIMLGVAYLNMYVFN